MPHRSNDGTPSHPDARKAVQPPNRRRMLGLAAGTAAAGAALSAARLADTAQAQAPAEFIGVWMIDFRVTEEPGAPPLPENPWPALFSQDGSIVISFRPSTLASTGGRSYSSTALGLWARVGDRRFTWAYTVFNWDERNQLANRGETRATVEVDATGNAFQGAFTGGTYDPQGVFTPSSGGAVIGRRLLTLTAPTP